MTKVGWIFLVGSALMGALTNLAFQIYIDPHQFCSSVQEQCSREWVSALSGWAGAAAGSAAVIYLALQIRETDRQNRFANTVNLWSKRALAKRCLYRATVFAGLMDNVLLLTGAAKMPRDFALYVSQIDSALRDVSSFLNDPAFERFEEQIESPSNHIDLLRNAILALGDRVRADLNGIPTIGALGVDVDSSCRMVRHYMSEIGMLADKFIEATDAMV
jgi:hypothetical protein